MLEHVQTGFWGVFLSSLVYNLLNKFSPPLDTSYSVSLLYGQEGGKYIYPFSLILLPL